MKRWLLGVDEDIKETEVAILTDEEALCSPDGHVLLMDGAKSVFDYHKDLAEELKAKREALWADTPWEEIRTQIIEMNNIRADGKMPAAPLGVFESPVIEGVRTYGMSLNPEPGVRLYGAQVNPPEANADIYIYLDGRGSDAVWEDPAPVLELTSKGHIVVVLSLRGTGRTEAKYSSESWWSHFGPDWQDTALGHLVGKPVLAMRTDEIFSIMETFKIAKRPGLGDDRRFHLIAIGEAVPPAIHAVALEPDFFKSVTLRGGITSWHEDVIQNPMAKNQYVNTGYNVLAVYDLPDLIGTLPDGLVSIED